MNEGFQTLQYNNLFGNLLIGFSDCSQNILLFDPEEKLFRISHCYDCLRP